MKALVAGVLCNGIGGVFTVRTEVLLCEQKTEEDNKRILASSRTYSALLKYQISKVYGCHGFF